MWQWLIDILCINITTSLYPKESRRELEQVNLHLETRVKNLQASLEKEKEENTKQQTMVRKWWAIFEKRCLELFPQCAGMEVAWDCMWDRRGISDVCRLDQHVLIQERKKQSCIRI